MSPLQVTDYHRSDADLDWFWIYCLVVANKSGDFAARKVYELAETIRRVQNDFSGKEDSRRPLERLAAHPEGLHNVLVANKVGMYTKLERAIPASAKLDLRTCTVQDLMKIWGVGPKTARFFLLHSRPDVEVAVLDTHVLRWLKSHQVNAPKATPQNRDEYESLERLTINLFRTFYPELTLAQADLLVWSAMSGRLDDDPAFGDFWEAKQ